MVSWSARVRTASLDLTDPISSYRELKLVENYGHPDACTIDGRLSRLRPGILPGSGILVVDELGRQRFSGQLVGIERRWDGTGTLSYLSDTARLWWRLCYPTPTAAWSTAGQTSAYDVQTASVEDRIIGYVNRNAGPAALAGRRITGLRLPTSLGRGATGQTSARFQLVGELVAALAESAGLRVRVVQTYDGTTPYLDLVITAAPDLSAWARFGTTSDGGPGLLGKDAYYRTEMPDGSALLSAAGGEGAARILNELDQTAAAEAAPWGQRVEKLVDQRGTTATPEINEGLYKAWLESWGLREVSAPIASGDLEVGSDEPGSVPIGAKVAVAMDGQLMVERVRQVTTTISKSGATKKVEPVFGSQEVPPRVPHPKKFREMLRRLKVLERI